MTQYPLEGTGVALITPFKRNGDIDYHALEQIVENTIAGGVDFLVPLGTTGEAITLTPKESRTVFDHILKINSGRLPVVAGNFGGNNTSNICTKIKSFNFDGFDYIMSSNPSYNKPTQEGIYQHYMKIAEASPLPIIIYNVPSRTASNITATTTIRLANSSEKFIAIKEASGDLNQASNILKYVPQNFAVLSGDDTLTLPMMSLGAKGVISVIANAYPFEFSEMVRTAQKGNYAKAQHYHQLLLNIHPWLYADGNPAGIKAAMNIMRYCENKLRLPLVKVTPHTYQCLKEEIEKVKNNNDLGVPPSGSGYP